MAREYCFCERDSHAFSGKKVPIKGKGKGGWGAMELGGGVVVAQSSDECITIWMSDDEAQ